MLTPVEIERLLTKKEVHMIDHDVQRAAQEWDLPGSYVSPGRIALVYSYVKSKYVPGETLWEMEASLGVCKESISLALRALEENGYVAISKAIKPYRYAVIK